MYQIEASINGTWQPLVGMKDRSKLYLLGHLHHHRDSPGPRLAWRLVAPDGRVVEEVPALNDVSIGMVAGWPTPAQYRAAGEKALALARDCEARGNKK